MVKRRPTRGQHWPTHKTIPTQEDVRDDGLGRAFQRRFVKQAPSPWPGRTARRAADRAASGCARREAPPPELSEAGREETHHATDRNRRTPTREVGDLPDDGP